MCRRPCGPYQWWRPSQWRGLINRRRVPLAYSDRSPRANLVLSPILLRRMTWPRGDAHYQQIKGIQSPVEARNMSFSRRKEPRCNNPEPSFRRFLNHFTACC